MTANTIDRVPFPFRVGELTLGKVERRLVVKKANPFGPRSSAVGVDSFVDLPPEAHGILFRSQPIQQKLPRVSRHPEYLQYVPRQYERFFADLRTSYDEYLRSFSSKSRSSLRRKVRKVERNSGGTVRWAVYRTRSELEEFYKDSRQVSMKTYQERLLGVGLPADNAFRERMLEAAEQNRVRGYLLFLEGRPAAYLYCSIQDGVVCYDYLGYLRRYADLSPGTVLLWLAMEDLFEDGQFRVFDFTEGGAASKHGQKSRFATASVTCADIYLLKPTISNATIVLSHLAIERSVEIIGNALEQLRIKQLVKRVTRRLSGAGP